MNWSLILDTAQIRVPAQSLVANASRPSIPEKWVQITIPSEKYSINGSFSPSAIIAGIECLGR